MGEWTRLRQVFAVLATGLLLAGCGGSHVSANSGRPGVTARLVLGSHRVPSGGTLDGRLVLTNTTSKPVVLLRGCLVDGRFAVGLRADRPGLGQGAAFSAVGCSPLQRLVVAKPGASAYRFTLKADYQVCSGSAKDEVPKSSKYWTPLCLRDSSGRRNEMPELPAGKYQAEFFTGSKWKGPEVRSPAVTVTKAP